MRNNGRSSQLAHNAHPPLQPGPHLFTHAPPKPPFSPFSAHTHTHTHTHEVFSVRVLIISHSTRLFYSADTFEGFERGRSGERWKRGQAEGREKKRENEIPADPFEACFSSVFLFLPPTDLRFHYRCEEGQKPRARRVAPPYLIAAYNARMNVCVCFLRIPMGRHLQHATTFWSWSTCGFRARMFAPKVF